MIRCYLFIFISQFTILFAMILKHEIKSLRIDWQAFNKSKIKELLSFSLTMALATIASIALRNIDILIMGIYLPLGQIAIYTIAITIAGIIEAPAAALGKIADAKIANAFSANNLKEISEIYFKSTRILMFIGFLLFSLISLNITDLLTFLPNKYGEGKTVILIVGLSALFNMMTGINSSIIFYSNKHKQGTILLIFLILSSVILNFILIPKYGIIGAALATSINLLFYNLFKLLMIYFYFKLQPFGAYVYKIIAVSAVCFICCYFIEIGIYINILLKSILIMIFFGIAAFKFNILPEFQEIINKYLKF